MINVQLYADANLKDNVKYRSGGLANSTPIGAVVAVSNGAIANENIYADNSVEISIPIDTCARANYIGLTIGSTTIAGQIVGLDYINENNTNVEYVIDYFTTAQMTNALRNGFFTSAFGLCRRTNLTYPLESVANQQPEPYSGNDYRWNDSKLTEMFNEFVADYTGINYGTPNVLSAGYRFILWISAFAVDALEHAGVSLSPWDEDPSGPAAKHVETVPMFGGSGSANRLWYKSFATGFPIVFSTTGGLTNFIDRMLSLIGERVIINADGIDGDGTIRRYVNIETQYFYSPQEYTQTQADEMKTVEMEQVKMITDEDILRIQIVPENFCNDNPTPPSETKQILTGYDLSTFNPMRDEKITILPDGTIVNDYSKSKLMTYPYWYHELETRLGNKITIMPQLHWYVSNYTQFNYIIKATLRFVGGNMPKLMISIQDLNDQSVAPEDPASATVWHTIFEYPSISWANNVSSQQQIGELQARMNRIGQQQSGVIGASTKGTGFQYGLRGGKPNPNVQGGLRSIVTSIGNSVQSGFRGVQTKVGNDNPQYPGAVGGINKGTYALDNELNAQTAMDNAGRIVGNNPVQILGEGSIEMLTSQPLACYRCGMTDGELFGFARFIERKGQTCHLNINPLTNAGDIFSGNATITSYGGKTYYEFFDLDVVGTMPVDFKNAIQMMFCGGCYLMG